MADETIQERGPVRILDVESDTLPLLQTTSTTDGGYGTVFGSALYKTSSLPIVHVQPSFEDFRTVVGAPPAPEDAVQSESKTTISGVISLLLIGVFLAGADGSLVMATYGTIASGFEQMQNASWLTTSYILAMCATQPISSKLSDIYGRKSVLLASYALFAVGTVICGIARSMSEFIVGRVIAGFGGAGMDILVAIIITDMVPLLEVAKWRSYVNVVATLGRVSGGPLGGLLADTVGWRWSFIVQGPLTCIGILLVWLKLEQPEVQKHESQDSSQDVSIFKRIDFIGATLLAIAVTGILMVLNLGGQQLPFLSPIIISLVATSMVTGTIFFYYEAHYAWDPIFPPSLLLNRDVCCAYGLSGFQLAAQMAMLYSIPIYFQLTEDASNANAGAHLFPAVVGNTLGGLLTGLYINRSGRYKTVTILGTSMAIIAYTLLIIRWRGHTDYLESLYVAPGGIGNGIVMASSFIGLSVAVTPDLMSAATAGQYLAYSLGMVGGVSCGSSVLQMSLEWLLNQRLKSDGASKIIEEVLSDMASLKLLEGETKGIVVQSYIQSIGISHVVSIAFACIALVLAVTMNEKRLK